MRRFLNFFWTRKIVSYTAILFLFFISFFFVFGNSFSFGKQLIPYDIAWQTDDFFLKSNYRAINPLTSDIVFLFLPWRNFIHSHLGLKQGIPFWNPAILTGVPFFGNGQSSIFELTKLISYILNFSAPSGISLTIVLSFIFSGFFTFLFARSLRMDLISSIAGGLIFMLSGPVIVWSSYALMSVFLWLPFILFCVEKILNQHDYYLLPLALAIFFQFLAGNLQITLFIFAFVIAYLLSRGLFFSLKNINVIKKIFIGSAVGLLLAAFQVFPIANNILSSESFQVGRGFAHSIGIKQAVVALKDEFHNPQATLVNKVKSLFYLLFNAEAFGNPLKNNWRPNSYLSRKNFAETTIYLSSVALILALVGLFFSKRKLLKLFLGGSGILSLLVSFSIPPFSLISFLPLIDRVNTDRLRLLYVFCFSILAALGTEVLVHKISKIKLKIVLISLIGLVIIIQAKLIFGAYHNWQNDIITPEQKNIISMIAQNLENYRVSGLRTRDGFNSPFIPNTLMSYGIQDIRGYEALTANFYSSFTQPMLSQQGTRWWQDNNEEFLLNILNVKYIICKHPCLSLPYSLIFSNDKVDIFFNQSVYPKVFLVPNIIFSSDNNAFSSRVQLTMYPEWRNSVIFESNNKVRADIKGVDLNPGETAVISNYSADKVTIDVTTNATRALFFSDAYYPGWTATIDNQPTSVYRANKIFRGVIVPAGHHIVIFSYLPPGFRAGLITSGFGLLILIYLVYYFINFHVHRA